MGEEKGWCDEVKRERNLKYPHGATYRHHFAKTGKNNFQVIVVSDGVQFAHKQHIFRGFHICVGQVTHLDHTKVTNPART